MTQTKLMTADELLARPNDGMRYELVRGELITMAPAGSEHGGMGMDVAAPLGVFVKKNKLGRTFLAETGFKIAENPDTVRAPDMSFVRATRIPSNGPPKGYFPGAPDLAVEVVSPGGTVYEVSTEVSTKVEEWLEAGTAQVWVVNPKRRTITIHTATGEQTLREHETLDGGELLPGFTLPLSDVFA